MTKRRISDGLRHAMRRGRTLVQRPGVDGLAVLVIDTDDDLRGGVVTGSMHGSPAMMTAMAAYLLKRVRDDAQEQDQDAETVEAIARIDAALAAIFGDALDRPAAQPGAFH